MTHLILYLEEDDPRLEGWMPSAGDRLEIGNGMLATIVGECIGVRERSGRIGFVIEWADNIEVATLEGGGVVNGTN